MDPERKAKLEARGYWVGDAEDFLGLTPHEREMVDLRLRLSREIRESRERRGISQAAFARAMKTSQARVSRIEAGYSDVSIELMLRALDVAGRGVSFHFTDRPRPAGTRVGKAGPPPTPARPPSVQEEEPNQGDATPAPSSENPLYVLPPGRHGRPLPRAITFEGDD
jgi:transcriptional regulator with XRE-family HTH domain